MWCTDDGAARWGQKNGCCATLEDGTRASGTAAVRLETNAAAARRSDVQGGLPRDRRYAETRGTHVFEKAPLTGKARAN